MDVLERLKTDAKRMRGCAITDETGFTVKRFFMRLRPFVQLCNNRKRKMRKFDLQPSFFSVKITY